MVVATSALYHDFDRSGEENPSLQELQQKVEEYTTFIDQTLHPELRKAVSSREETQAEIAEYQELREKLCLLEKRETPEPLESLVSLGYDMAHCRAVVDDPTIVCLHVGMGFHTEFTLSEAVSFIDRRTLFLEQVLSHQAEKAQTVASHLESALLILEVLAKELQEMETTKE